MRWYPVIANDNGFERNRITEASFARAIRLGEKLVNENLADSVRVTDESGRTLALVERD